MAYGFYCYNSHSLRSEILLKFFVMMFCVLEGRGPKSPEFASDISSGTLKYACHAFSQA